MLDWQESVRADIWSARLLYINKFIFLISKAMPKKRRATKKVQKKNEGLHISWPVLGLIIVIGLLIGLWQLTSKSEAAVTRPFNIVAANPSGRGTIMPGATVDLYKLRITATTTNPTQIFDGYASDYAIGFKRFTFYVASKAKSTSASLSNFRIIRNGVDITNGTSINNVSFASNAYTVKGESNPVRTGFIQVSWYAEPNLGGMERLNLDRVGELNYTLRATCGAGYVPGDSISTTMLNDQFSLPSTIKYLKDFDLASGNNHQSIGLQDAYGKKSIATNFIWAYWPLYGNFNSGFNDKGGVTPRSDNFFNGYGIKNFPLPSYVLAL